MTITIMTNLRDLIMKILNRSKKRELLITVDLSEATIDEDLLVQNAVILGSESTNANGKVYRRYTEKCMAAAIPIFEGAPAFTDHPAKNKERDHRSVRDMYGTYRHVRIEEGKLRGDLQIFDHTLGQHVAAIIRKNPAAVGNSIRTAGRVRMESGVQIVEEIFPRDKWGIKASVDLVNDPATTSSLFESQQFSKESDMDLKDVTLTELREACPSLVTRLIAEGKSTQDDELKALKEQVETLTKEKTSLTEEVTTLKQAEAVHAIGITVSKALSESKLPEAKVTDVFRNSLLALTEQKDGDKVVTVADQVKALIEERELLVGVRTHEKKGVTGAGGDYTPIAEAKASGGDSSKVIGSLKEFQVS